MAMTSCPDSLFVTGTDTGVGKTVVSAALALALTRDGKNVAVMKPIQTGTEQPGLTDLEFVEKALDVKFASEYSCPYSFPLPLAPYTAAQSAGQEIVVDKIKNAFQALRSSHDMVIVEGAGGLLVPILEDYLMSDLASELSLPVLIVTRPDLGTLNHTLLTVESAKRRGLEVLGIVINNFPPSPGDAERTNPGLLKRMSGVPILGVYPSDLSLSVEQGRIGEIRRLAPSALSPVFGGTFDEDSFLSALGNLRPV